MNTNTFFKIIKSYFKNLTSYMQKEMNKKFLEIKNRNLFINSLKVIKNIIEFCYLLFFV